MSGSDPPQAPGPDGAAGGSQVEQAVDGGRVRAGDVEGLGAGGGAGDERDGAPGDGQGFGDGGEGGVGGAAVDGAFADADDQGAVVVAADAGWREPGWTRIVTRICVA